MKQLINHHVHTTGSDGVMSPKEVIELAIKSKLSFICFTDHYPRPVIDKWANDFFNKDYIKEIKSVKKEYQNKIEISFGVEFDWYEGSENWIKKEIKKHDFDFVMGSVHMLKSKENNYFGINFDEPILIKEIEKSKGMKKIIQEYYRQIRLMARSKIFDCVGHLDVIKTYNENSKLFNENEDWYKEEVIKTLNEIKNNDLVMEINTSGFTYECKEQFPSFWIINEANKLNIPITIGADTHEPERIIDNLDKAIELAKKAGYSSILKFKNRKRIKVKI